MYGDVFGNRLEFSAADDGEASHVSWEPVREPVLAAVIPVSAKYALTRAFNLNDPPCLDTFAVALQRYDKLVRAGYNPWTKTSYRLDRGVRWWCFRPGSVVWHASVQYTLGSVLFVLASYFALFDAVVGDVWKKRWLFAYPYAIGSIMYTIGASLLLGVSWVNHPEWAHPPRPPQMLLGRDNADSRTEASRAFTESLPPSVAPSVRDASDFSATWNSVDPSRETPIVSRSVTLVVDDGRTDSGAAAGTPKADAATPARSGNSTSRHSPASPSRGRKGGTHFSLDDVMSGESDSVCTTPSAASWPKRGPQSLADTEVLSPAESQRTPRDVPAGRSERTSYVRTFMNRWRTTSTAENITTALLAHHPRDYAQMNDMLRGHYTKDANYYVHTDPWYTTRWRLDFAGSFSIWVGALLYNVSCFSGAFEAAYHHLPRVAGDPKTCEAILAFWPDVIGGILFVLGSYFFWWAQHETPSLIVRKPFTVEWFLTFFNMLGSVGFWYGAASTAPLMGVPGLVGNWVQLLIGYVLGSFFFLLGSYLMIAEVATTSVRSDTPAL